MSCPSVSRALSARRTVYRRMSRSSNAVEPTTDAAPPVISVCNAFVTSHMNCAILAILAIEKSTSYLFSIACAGSSPARLTMVKSFIANTLITTARLAVTL